MVGRELPPSELGKKVIDKWLHEELKRRLIMFKILHGKPKI